MTLLQSQVLDYLRLNPGARTWKVARDVFNAARDGEGRVNVASAAVVLGSLTRRGYVRREAAGWLVTQAGHEALVAFAFGAE